MSNMCAKRHQQGFTLLEIMVALVIFSLIAVGASSLLVNLQRSQAALGDQGRQLEDLQRLMITLRHDISQMAPATAPLLQNNTPPSDTSSDTSSTESPPPPLLAFASSGWRNPLGEERSTVAYTRYVLVNGDFVRQLLPLAQYTRPDPFLSRTLASDVMGASFSPVMPVSDTPPNPGDPTPLPAAVEVNVTLPLFADVRELVPLTEEAQTR